MSRAGFERSSPQPGVLRGEEMRTPDEVAAMLRLRALGWGTKRISAELGCSRNTVKRYIETGGWGAYKKPHRSRTLDGLEGWIAERFFQHRGNADVVRQELESELGVKVSLRTVERAALSARPSTPASASPETKKASREGGSFRSVTVENLGGELGCGDAQPTL